MEGTNNFYERLPKHSGPLHKTISRLDLFNSVPNDWYVVMADVQNSTIAVENGLHNEVNLAATGSIIAVLNEIKKQPKTYKIAYFFGGDGATFLVPPTLIVHVSTIIEDYRTHVSENLFLNLRVGRMQVIDIVNTGHTIAVAKHRVTEYLTIPVVLGTGLKYAEQVIKDSFVLETTHKTLATPVNLMGMECRWDEIKPSEDVNKIVCLLVSCDDDSMQPAVYSGVLMKIQEIFGTMVERRPISRTKLKLDASIAKLRKEMSARIGKFKLGYLLKNWFYTYLGGFYFKYFEEGKRYLDKISLLSDTLMIDGTINTVLEGGTPEIEALVEYLDAVEQEGKLNYGIHVTYASVMSCYVQDRKDKHIHFVDGTEGGYTSAALMLKKKQKLI
ncbi:DUF3095 family protein [Maribacter chungangensis]|uniref:DUF3095 family protein n=1 Tax=Maribacter chungangensis TaxID=1069117 RepID=A0ABW3B7A2_9FLAO